MDSSDKIAIIFGVAFAISIVVWLWMDAKHDKEMEKLKIRERYWHSRYFKMQHERNLARISANQKQDLYDELINRIRLAAQAEAKRIMSEWEPSAKLTEAEFRKAEFMANQREMRDAGRRSMPREDQDGMPAVVRKFHKKRK